MYHSRVAWVPSFSSTQDKELRPAYSSGNISHAPCGCALHFSKRCRVCASGGQNYINTAALVGVIEGLPRPSERTGELRELLLRAGHHVVLLVLLTRHVCHISYYVEGRMITLMHGYGFAE